jgi:hypothetical protein
MVISNFSTMHNTINELRQIVSEYATKIASISEQEFSAKPLPNKWSKKEVLGHLIDSAQNNLRRFVCGQYENAPPKISYDQDFWVRANGYQSVSQKDIIQLWQLINAQIASILSAMPATDYKKTCDTGKQIPQLRSLEWLADDYVKHMKHHLNQIISGSFNIQYP